MHLHIRLLLLAMLFGAGPAIAASPDSLVITTTSDKLNQGDTLYWQAALPQFNKSNAAVTVQVWIQSLATGQLWKYRYPMLNGSAEGGIAIDASLPSGDYAFNFLLQKDFFNIQGKVRDARKRDTALNYMLVAKDKETILKSLQLKAGGFFAVGKYLFEDTALFIFSPAGKRSSNDLWIDVATSLDSSFTLAATITKLVTVGHPDTTTPSLFAQKDTYRFDFQASRSAQQLGEITVVGKAKKKLEDFEKEQVSGRFRGIDDITFNGLDDNQIANSTDLITFLMANLPGVGLQPDSESGMNVLMYRNHRVSFFIDEFRVDSDAPLSINPADVALIKFLRPNGITGGAGGTIAIYTKTGDYSSSNASRKYTFYIRGYDPLNTHWK